MRLNENLTNKGFMKAIDQKWVVPILFVTVVSFIAVTAMSVGTTWYENEKTQLGSVSASELGGWMIQGKNDYATVFIAREVKKIDKINGLVCIIEETGFEKELAKLPGYKKWIVITPDGNISQSTIDALVEATSGTVLLLNGGQQAWEEKILAPSIENLSLESAEEVALGNVRPFFQETALTSSGSQAIQPVTPAVKADSSEEEEEEEEEEGC